MTAPRRRSPVQTLVVALAVAVGLVFGTRLVTQAREGEEAARRERHLPDLQVIDATPDEVVAAGFGGAAMPTTWSEISLRLFEDADGFVNCLRCRIDASEVDRLIAFPPGSRTPADGRPPADWPWGSDQDRWRVPAWWNPREPGWTRLYEAFPGQGLARGVYASYDPQTRWLHTWMWTRAWTPSRPPPEGVRIADAAAHVLGEHALREAWPADETGWFVRTDLSALSAPGLAQVLPASCERLDAAFLPRAGRHRYLLRLVGVDAAEAEVFAGGVPLRRLPEDAPLPDCPFAQPSAGLPAWFTVGTGPRFVHALRRVSDGGILGLRWAAYDPALRTLLVWDWSEEEARPADLIRDPPLPTR